MLSEVPRESPKPAARRCAHPLLVVEDDPDIREALSDLLEGEGYAVRTAANGVEALHRLAAKPRPCVILLDLMMPVMNGWEFLVEKNRSQALSQIPVVVVSAVNGGAPNVSAIMPKPLDVDRLLSIVRALCFGKPVNRA